MKVKEIRYNPETTILKCNKCNREQIEWYNDQPGDKCDGPCNGILIRVEKL